jgi:phosphoenolpyruvate carboxylase
VRLIRRTRSEADEKEQEKWFMSMMRSINAIASGMRNTG